MPRYYAKQLHCKIYWGNYFIKYGIVICLMIYKSYVTIAKMHIKWLIKCNVMHLRNPDFMMVLLSILARFVKWEPMYQLRTLQTKLTKQLLYLVQQGKYLLIRKKKSILNLQKSVPIKVYLNIWGMFLYIIIWNV